MKKEKAEYWENWGSKNLHEINLKYHDKRQRERERARRGVWIFELVASPLAALHIIIIIIIKAMVTMYDDEAQNHNNLCICVVQYDGTAQY